MPAHVYAAPGFFTRRVFDPIVAFFARRLGRSLNGARVLSVQGRKSSERHDPPVNPLSFAGRRCLVAPRGDVEEVADHDKPPILRAYRCLRSDRLQTPGISDRA